jgi:hypothetical protein
MSSHHDDHNHSTEPKKVHFSTPLIMGLVTILLILIAVSTCDHKKHEASEEGAAAAHEEVATETHHNTSTVAHEVAVDTTVKASVDTLVIDTLAAHKTNTSH